MYNWKKELENEESDMSIDDFKSVGSLFKPPTKWKRLVPANTQKNTI